MGKNQGWDSSSSSSSSSAKLILLLQPNLLLLLRSHVLAFLLVLMLKMQFSQWIEQASEPNKEAVIKALLGAKEAMLGIRYHMRLMGEAAGVPIEPKSQTKLLDATLNLEGVLLAGVPGVGGFDAVFAVTLGDSSSNVTKTWSSLNVLALLVKEDPCGVSLESADPRTNEIT
ncbi:putative phosphomevalonate kinase [Arachis hypogaea]|nr:putative phosphomevalonate kinase [Arachis hypogaea]